MNETDWDKLCTQARALPATIAEQLAIRDERIGDLKAALDDVLGEVAWLSRRVAETEEALAPFARFGAPPDWCPDDELLVDDYALTAGDVRRARRVLGEGGK